MEPGPMLIVLGGIHGNEPAGLLALEPLIDGLALAAGDFVALSGNRAALAAGVRYIERDLNRGWSDEAIKALGDAPEIELEPFQPAKVR